MYLKRILGAVALTVLVATTGLASDPSLPCSPVPGQTETMPCSAAAETADTPNELGQTQTPPSSVIVDVTLVFEEALVTLLLY